MTSDDPCLRSEKPVLLKEYAFGGGSEALGILEEEAYFKTLLHVLPTRCVVVPSALCDSSDDISLGWLWSYQDGSSTKWIPRQTVG